jgi:hypothetical protein
MTRYATHQHNGTLFLDLEGDLSGQAGTALVPELIKAVRGKALARRARKHGFTPYAAPTMIEVDITGVTQLGVNGVSLLWGIFRMAQCPIVCRAGEWTKTINLLCRAKKNGTSPIPTI